MTRAYRFRYIAKRGDNSLVHATASFQRTLSVLTERTVSTSTHDSDRRVAEPAVAGRRPFRSGSNNKDPPVKRGVFHFRVKP